MGAVTVFNRKPNLSELKRIWSLDQPSNENAGLSEFRYSCTLPTASTITSSTDSNISPININSRTHKNYITDGKKNLNFSNSACLFDTGNLFADVISEKLAIKLGIEYRKNEARLQSANGVAITIVGQASENIYFMIPPIKTLFYFKPYVVEHLFNDIMMSGRFNKRYLVSLDALDDSMLIQTKRSEPRTKVFLHTNAISRALVLLDRRDLKRLRRNNATNKLTESATGHNIKYDGKFHKIKKL